MKRQLILVFIVCLLLALTCLSWAGSGRYPVPVSQINPAPKELLKLAPVDVLEGLLKVGLSNFYHRADSYAWTPDCTDKETPTGKDCQVVYGLLVPDDFWEYVPNEYQYDYLDFQPKLKKLVFTIIKSPKLREITYNWVKPHYEEAFLRLTPESQQIYLEAVEHAQKYLKSFNYQQELAYLKDLKTKNRQELNDCLSYSNEPTYCYERIDLERGFTYRDSKGSDHHFRKIEAFIFRRVHNGDMSVNELCFWVDKLHQDIIALQQKSQNTPKNP